MGKIKFMKDIAIFGAGGFGKEVACLIKKINESHSEPIWNLIGFFDDGKKIGDKVSHFGEVLGGLTELNKYSKELSIVIAVGNPSIVKNIFEKIDNELISFPNIIHPGVFFSDEDTFNIGKGNILQGGCAFSCDVGIGDFNIFNGSVVLGHDVKVGNFNTFMPAVRISGEVSVGNRNFFGVASIVLQQIKIGENIRLGAGSVLMRKPKDGTLYIGNPAKKTEF